MTPTMILALPLLTAQVELRGQREPLPNPVVAVSLAGVDIGAPNARTVGWDEVRTVRGEFADEAAPFIDYAETAWRARTRLVRADAIGAEPLFEELFPAFAWTDGPTAHLVCEGLLRCQLRRGAHAVAIESWLATLVAADHRPSPLGARDMLDASIGLCPVLPPIWLAEPGLEVLAKRDPLGRLDEQARGAIGAEVQELAAWYRASAQLELGLAVELPPDSAGSPAVDLVSDIVTARFGDADARRVAIAALRSRLPGAEGTWIEAWCRAGIGRALVREQDPDDRRLGVVSLLHLPARFSDSLTDLAGICLAEAAIALEGLGQTHEAGVIVQELQTRYPGHPVLGWSQLRDLVASAGAGRRNERKDRTND